MQISDKIEYVQLPLELGASYCYKDTIFAGDVSDGSFYNSTDEGLTWNKLTQLQDGNGTIRCVFVSSTGSIFVSRDKSGKLMKSINHGQRFEPCLFLSNKKASTVWHMAENTNGWLFVAEYSNLSWNDSCAYIYRSEDDGNTWETIYDNPTGARHFHFVDIDPYTNNIYAAYGDGKERAGFIRSVDNGDTWELIGNNKTNPDIDWQFTSIVFTPNYRILGEDEPIQSDIVRTSDDIHFEKVFIPDSLEQYNFWAWGRIDNDGNVLFGSWTQHNFLKDTVNESRGVVYLTQDEGDTWEKLIDFGLQEKHSGTHFASNIFNDEWIFFHSRGSNQRIKIRD
ncbi:hypothetical protein JW960_13540 [candidate division KSB1 bacterium]|nr:hypothetical protein [candidate division KSB1 bacterium]